MLWKSCGNTGKYGKVSRPQKEESLNHMITTEDKSTKLENTIVTQGQLRTDSISSILQN